VLKADVVVVGGGPTGAIVAREVARKGLRVVLLERAPHAPLRCAGIISLRAQEELGISEDLVLERLIGVAIHGPCGELAILTADSPKALVIDRVALDRRLREEAKEAGAAVWEGVSALGWEPPNLVTGREGVMATFLVGADGAMSNVARWVGLPRPREILVGYQAEIKAKPRYPGHAEIFLDPAIAPGFFAWAVPAGNTLRVGLVTNETRRGYELLQRLLSREFPTAKVASVAGGLIPIGPPLKTVADRVFLVGDAAGQVKPLTGGGIYYGGVAARLLGMLLAQEEGWKYETEWRGKLGSEIEFGLKARRAFLSLSPSELDYLVSLLRDPALGRFVLSRGDMDRPSRILHEIQRAPHLWPLGLKVLRALGGFSRFAGFLG